MRAGGKARTRRLAANSKAPRWMGIAAACAMVSPRTLKRAAEASSPSFTIGEAALLRSVSSISSAIVSRRLRSTSSKMGSMSMLLLPDSQVAGLLDRRRIARVDDRGRVWLLNDRRAVAALAHRQPRPVEERGQDEPSRGKVRAALPHVSIRKRPP